MQRSLLKIDSLFSFSRVLFISMLHFGVVGQLKQLQQTSSTEGGTRTEACSLAAGC